MQGKRSFSAYLGLAQGRINEEGGQKQVSIGHAEPYRVAG